MSTTLSNTTLTQPDLTAILSQVKGLEEEKAKLLKMLEDEKTRAKDAQARADKMSEGKRAEMKQALDTVIMNWLKDSVQASRDEKVREEFQQGMNRLVENTAEESGVWQVVACASTVHQRRLEEMERLKIENDALKLRGGEFRDESSRKRPREEEEQNRQPSNIWADFDADLRSGRQIGAL